MSAIIVNDSKVLLMHRKKEGREYWVFPGGGVEKDETSEQAAKREVLEETSLKVMKALLPGWEAVAASAIPVSARSLAASAIAFNNCVLSS